MSGENLECASYGTSVFLMKSLYPGPMKPFVRPAALDGVPSDAGHTFALFAEAPHNCFG
jgi:hypothetical protein